MAEQAAALDLSVATAAHAAVFAAADEWRELQDGAVNSAEGAREKNNNDDAERLKEKCIP